MKKILVIIMLAVVTLVTPCCERYLDVNKNVDAPDYVEGYLYLAGVIASYSDIYFDLRAAAPLAQMFGTSGYTSFANNSYSAGSDAAGLIWRMVYFDQGYNLENLINQSVEAEQYTLAGIGYAIKAFSWDMLTKYHGELPLQDAYVPGLLSHRYDQQKDVYAKVEEWALKAVEYLEMEDKTSYGSKIKNTDLIYGGNKALWIKFAYSTIVRSLASLSNKSDFTTVYAPKLLQYADKAFQTAADDATVKTIGGAGEAQFSSYNNAFGVYRGNLSNSYWQHDYAVQIMTGTVPKYDEQTGDKYRSLGSEDNKYRPYELNEKQIICDTLVNEIGHYDPRIAAKLSTTDEPYYKNIGNRDSVLAMKYYGSGKTGASGPIGTAPSLYGRIAVSNTKYDGIGRWIFRDNAPYILMTAAEIKFCVAETYWKLNRKAEALEVWKEGVAQDIAFTRNYLDPGSYLAPGDDGKEILGGAKPGGDKITKELFDELAAEYLAGPFVGGLSLTDFTLSHIMMQKWVALWPWGAIEAWTDLRKYHYDVKYNGEYPSLGNGYELTLVNQKWDSDESKVYKGFYLYPAQVENRRASYGTSNYGVPCYRIRPRYNSEYMWNKPSLDALKPISGLADNYHTSIPWFAYPNEYPVQ